MSPEAGYVISVFLGFVVWGMISARYVRPALRDRPRTEALRPLLFLHAFRFVGLAFLVPGVVSPDLPAPSPRDARARVPNRAPHRTSGRSTAWPTFGLIADFRDGASENGGGPKCLISAWC
jgi:hypothetical protein